MDDRRPEQRRRSSARSAHVGVNNVSDGSSGDGTSFNEPGQELRVETGKAPPPTATAQSSHVGALPYALSFAVTPSEAYKVQRGLAKLGVVAPPMHRLPSNASTNPPTPTPSYPGTPNALPRGSSPFVPMTAINSSSSKEDLVGAASKIKPVQPQIQLALQNALDDSILPLTTRMTLRSFVSGYLLQSALAVLPALMRRKGAKETIRGFYKNGNARVGFSFALFTFLYRTLSYVLTFARLKALASLPTLAPSSLTFASTRVRLLARLIRLLRGDGTVPFLSVVLASPALHLLPAQTANRSGGVTFPRKTFALDLFTKGLYLQIDALKKRRSALVTWIPEWCDTALLYAIGNGQLLWAFLFQPDCFPKSYGDFILGRSSAYVPARPEGLPDAITWPSRREIVDHVALLSTPSKSFSPFPAFQSPALAALHPSKHPTTPYTAINPVLDWSPAHSSHESLMCALLHPSEPSCKANYLNYWAKEWKQSAKFVAFVTAFFNLFKLRGWRRDPEGSLFRFAMSVAQGATVISGSIATAWAFTCLFQHYLPRNFIPRTRFFLNGFLSSVFIFAVPAARRAQIGLYVTRLSMDSTWQIMVKQRKARSVRNGDVFLLTLGLAMLAAVYESVPYLLSGYLRRILRTLTGPRVTGTPVALAGLSIEGIDQTPAWSPAPVDANALDSRLRSRAKSRTSRTGSESFFSSAN